MIRNFSDHAGNERTFLAWVRTAIAVMAFGFLVAKFNLFIKIAASSLTGHRHAVAVPGGAFGGAAGIVLIVSGATMVAVAAVRFIRIGRAIDSPEQRTDGTRVDVALAALMVALGVALLAYLSHTLASGL